MSRKLSVSLALILAGLWVAGCAYETLEVPEDHDSQLYGCGQWEEAGSPCISIWAPDDINLPRSEIMGGCDLWADTGLKCVFVDEDDRGLADVEIYSRDAACVAQPDGTVVLARAHWNGAIVSESACMQAGGYLDLRLFRNTMGHELGHLLGIWDHVPGSCDDPDVKNHNDGPGICGKALMNPYINADLEEITSMDWLAYDMRNTNTPSAPGNDIMDEALAGPE